MIVYATDEDVALRASSDFMALCPRDQTLALGNDGAFSAEDRWTLLSTTVNFSGSGLRPGHLIRLTRPTAAFGPAGEVLVIQSVSPGGAVLRRKGQGPGVGQPPAPPSGVIGAEFAVRTLGPQIERASDDLAIRLRIHDSVAGPLPIDLPDPFEIREAVVLTVLYRQFLDLSREYSGAKDQPDDWYAAKARLIKAELAEQLARLEGRRDSSRGGPAGLTRFGVRVSR